MSSTDGPADELELRRAGPDDASDVAAVFLAARRAAVPAMPPTVHGPDEVRRHLAMRIDQGEVWVAEGRAGVVGYLDLEPRWLDSLYVLPEHAGRGVGGALLELAKSLRPGGFALWVFESNTPARRFYQRHGLVELERTDGTDNEERSPDLRMAWPGTDPLGYLRAEVDRVDSDLAVVIARRAALTAAIQAFKEVPGHAGRDPAREAEIAARMAARAPGLSLEGWRRIMHEVISVSLDAAEPGRR